MDEVFGTHSGEPRLVPVRGQLADSTLAGRVWAASVDLAIFDPDSVLSEDDKGCHEHTMSTRRRRTITSKIFSDKKPQVSRQGSGRAPGARTRNLWIKSPQLCQLS